MSPTGVTSFVAGRLAEDRERLLRRLLAAQGEHDVEAALACFHRPRYELIGGNRVYEGSEEVRGYYERITKWFPDLHFEVIALHHSTDAVVTEVWMSGTHLGAAGTDVQATGRCFRCRTAIVFSFDGDRLVGARVYYDTGTIARQLA